ncbi:hypothetical protein Tco_0854231 [Tanacetum coccineum]
MNQEQIRQVTARDKKWVPAKERVKISTINVRLETTVPQKEETFQVIIDVIKNSTCYKAFTIFAEKCVVDAEVFQKILDICPRVQGVDFSKVPDDETILTFLIVLGYKGPLYKHPNMENFDYPKLIWEDFTFQIDHRQLKKGRHENIPYPRLKFVRIGIIPPKKSRGKGLQGKKTADTTEEIIDVSEESDFEPARKRTASRRVLGKSTSLTEAAEEEASRQVHATLVRIVTKSFPDPASRRPSGVAFRDAASVTKTMSPDPF